MSSADPTAALHQQIDDFRAEARALDETLAGVPESAWTRPTGFKQWTVWDIVAHLHQGDTMGVTTLGSPDEFRALRRAMTDSGLTRLDFTRQWVGALSGSELLARWRDGYETLCDAFMSADPTARLEWSGPGMKPRMFVTARQMETWSHGWAIYDLLGERRVHHDRLRNIATLGVRTYGWTFTNRDLPLPGPAPFVQLQSPSGATWTWNDPQPDSQVIGSAVDFCQVVTQVRNIADVALEVTGEPASQWMAFAQCFAGPPETPPAPGTRGPVG